MRPATIPAGTPDRKVDHVHFLHGKDMEPWKDHQADNVGAPP